jgi:hypothetical protein
VTTAPRVRQWAHHAPARHFCRPEAPSQRDRRSSNFCRIRWKHCNRLGAVADRSARARPRGDSETVFWPRPTYYDTMWRHEGANGPIRGRIPSCPSRIARNGRVTDVRRLAEDVISGTVGTQRRLGAFEHRQQFGLVGMQAREQASEVKEALPASATGKPTRRAILSHPPSALPRAPIGANATLALKTGACVPRARLVMVAPNPRDPRRSRAETPLIDLSEFGHPPLWRPERLMMTSQFQALPESQQAGRAAQGEPALSGRYCCETRSFVAYPDSQDKSSECSGRCRSITPPISLCASTKAMPARPNEACNLSSVAALGAVAPVSKSFKVRIGTPLFSASCSRDQSSRARAARH